MPKRKGVPKLSELLLEVPDLNATDFRRIIKKSNVSAATRAAESKALDEINAASQYFLLWQPTQIAANAKDRFDWFTEIEHDCERLLKQMGLRPGYNSDLHHQPSMDARQLFGALQFKWPAGDISKLKSSERKKAWTYEKLCKEAGLDHYMPYGLRSDDAFKCAVGAVRLLHFLAQEGAGRYRVESASRPSDEAKTRMSSAKEVRNKFIIKCFSAYETLTTKKPTQHLDDQSMRFVKNCALELARKLEQLKAEYKDMRADQGKSYEVQATKMATLLQRITATILRDVRKSAATS